MDIQETLKALYNELEEKAIEPQYYRYYIKDANQIIRKHFESYASQQMPSEEDILKEINCASFDVLIDDEFISVIRYSEMKKILKDEFGINKSLQQESQTEE